jgi:hypothetical protein
MTKTTSGNSGGGTFHIDNAAREIGLTRLGIIVATSEWRVYDWISDYIRPYENNRYAVKYAETEREFETLVKKARMAIAFIETDFFGEKTAACLERIRKKKYKAAGHSVCCYGSGMGGHKPVSLAGCGQFHISAGMAGTCQGTNETHL